MALQPGDRVGDYQILEVLGAGGMGKVYKVRNVISDRVEAMKVLLPNLQTEPELADRFAREIKVQASLDHPNIAALHTALRVDNQLIMLMEYVEGSTLEARIHAAPLPAQEGVDYICQALKALSFAHARGVIHRDIKPANIMLTPGGAVKLMDFGIAKLAADPKLTQTGHTVGSLFYMSPEQINGSTALDARSDLYSLGVSLYETVTGKRPFQGDSDYSIMSAHLAGTPIPPIQIDPRLPDALNEIILMSIAKEPERRFQTADAFRTALSNAVGMPHASVLPKPVTINPTAPVTPVLAVPAGAPLVAAASGSNRRGLYIAAGSLVTILVLAAAVIEGPRLFRSGAASPETGSISPDAPKVAPNGIESTAPVQTAQTAPPVNPADTPAESQFTEGHPTASAPEPAQAKPPQKANSSAVTGARARVLSPIPPMITDHGDAAIPQLGPTGVAVQPEANREMLAQAREQLMMLGTRAAAIKKSIGRIQSEQGSQGVGMRGDVTASVSRMEYQLDEAESALRSADSDKAKRALASAEREVERLEKFLNI